jgi:hypothetical protein
MARSSSGVPARGHRQGGPSARLARVEIQVVEGRFVEAPIAGATGMDRRAFGEFVGPQGELASYAFGWTTGSHPHVARMSVGIGVGNAGGGTFHAVVFLQKGDEAGCAGVRWGGMVVDMVERIESSPRK